MASPRRPPAKRKPRLLDGGTVAAFAEACNSGGTAVACGGSSGGLLARPFQMAREISGGVGGSAAAGIAADRAGILRAGSDGAARSAREIVDRIFWARVGLYVWRAGAGVGTLQLAVRRAAIDGGIRKCGSKATGRVGSSGRGKVADLLASDSAAVDSRGCNRRGAQLRTHDGRIWRGADGRWKSGRRDSNGFDRGV